MKQICFLYKGDEAGSRVLRDALGMQAIEHGVRFWSDTRATDPGFATELRDELGRADAIVMCVGSAGLGRYQAANEIDAAFDALQRNGSRRLVKILLDDTPPPDAFARLAALPNPQVSLPLRSEGVAAEAVTVIRAAIPDLIPVGNAPESKRAQELIRKTMIAPRPKSLTIVIGPYASAEIDRVDSTPESTMAWLVQNRTLPGMLPWLDVMGSLARATEKADDDAASLVQDAINATMGPSGTLEVYLRLLAANWVRKSSQSRLIIIVCTPDLRTDEAFKSAALPVPHVRLVHCPKREGRLFAERIDIVQGRADATEIAEPWKTKLAQHDRVVLVKPFGCFRDPESLLISAEHWRSSSRPDQMPLPSELANEIMKSAVVVLGAGAFSPSLHFVFHGLLREALQNADKHDFRYLVHDRQNELNDRLHQLERGLADQGSQHAARFERWLWETYALNLDRLRPLQLLLNLDHQLADLVT